jgi:hypothetical protein
VEIATGRKELGRRSGKGVKGEVHVRARKIYTAELLFLHH